MRTPDEPVPRHRRRSRAIGPDISKDDAAKEGGASNGGATATARAERGLRGLIGAGPSQLGVSGALRGRDVNRPTEDDLAEAERDVVIIRRNWKPPG